MTVPGALIAVVLWVVAILAAFLSYYAFVESKSTAWGIGYAVAAAVLLVAGWSIAVALRRRR